MHGEINTYNRGFIERILFSFSLLIVVIPNDLETLQNFQSHGLVNRGDSKLEIKFAWKEGLRSIKGKYLYLQYLQYLYKVGQIKSNIFECSIPSMGHHILFWDQISYTNPATDFERICNLYPMYPVLFNSIVFCTHEQTYFILHMHPVITQYAEEMYIRLQYCCNCHMY